MLGSLCRKRGSLVYFKTGFWSVNQTSLYATVAQDRPEVIIFTFLKYRKHINTHTHRQTDRCTHIHREGEGEHNLDMGQGNKPSK